jgi:hypothetical protein
MANSNYSGMRRMAHGHTGTRYTIMGREMVYGTTNVVNAVTQSVSPISAPFFHHVRATDASASTPIPI